MNSKTITILMIAEPKTTTLITYPFIQHILTDNSFLLPLSKAFVVVVVMMMVVFDNNKLTKGGMFVCSM